jgi:hypothetical protein
LGWDEKRVRLFLELTAFIGASSEAEKVEMLLELTDKSSHLGERTMLSQSLRHGITLSCSLCE